MAATRVLVVAGTLVVSVLFPYRYSLRSIWPGIAHTLEDGDISGWLTLGWFAFNRLCPPFPICPTFAQTARQFKLLPGNSVRKGALRRRQA